MEAWINQLFSYVDPTLGPWVVFALLLLSGIGIPLGEDIIIIPSGMIVAHGQMPLWPTLLAAYCGVVCGDLLWFMVCRKFGTRIIHKKWFKRFIHPKRINNAFKGASSMAINKNFLISVGCTETWICVIMGGAKGLNSITAMFDLLQL